VVLKKHFEKTSVTVKEIGAAYIALSLKLFLVFSNIG